jgi:hypothetical protein
MRRGLALAAMTVALTASCTVGDGEGTVRSESLRVAGCFDGPYDLEPTFFGAIPYRAQQFVRLQRRNDLIENSDGVEILVADTAKVRQKLGSALKVKLPAEVSPPGIPIMPDADPALVQLTLYLHDTCHGQVSALYAVDGTINFTHLFDGDPNETDAGEKLTEGTFDVHVGDPRDQPPAGGLIPPEKLSHLTGRFRFYFQRGQPAQPFP